MNPPTDQLQGRTSSGTPVRLYSRPDQLLTHSEEKKLTRCIRQAEASGSGDKGIDEREDPGVLHARGILVKRNQGLVASIARKHRDRGLPLEDLIQEGNIGLLKAIAKYDPDLGHRFSTYATWWIRQAITRAIDDKSRVVRLPVHFQQQLRAVRRAESDLSQAISARPGPGTIAQEMTSRTGKLWTAEMIETTRRSALESKSLDAPTSSRKKAAGNPPTSSVSLAGLLASPEHDYEANPESVTERIGHRHMIASLHEALDSLPAREREIIVDRYGLDGGPQSPLALISRKLGISPDRVKYLQNRAEDILRKSLAQCHYSHTAPLG